MNEKHEGTAFKFYKIIMLIILTAFITFMITSSLLYTYFSKNYAYINNESIDNKTSIAETNTVSGIDRYLKKVKSIIDEHYLWKDKIDEQKLKDSAIKGYVKGLGDEYTEYIPESEMEKFTETIEGSFVGIGIYMIADEDTEKIIIYYPIPNSPAEKAGLKPGDIIVSVDGVEYGYDEFNSIAKHIKGKEGTTVKLVIDRNGEKKNFEIIREKIEINPITSKVYDKDIGYIVLPSFDSDSAKRFKEKVDELMGKGIKSLIIDLRNNGGGIVSESEKIADLFLDKDKVVIKTKNNVGKEEINKTKEEKKYDIPIVILVNENSASASEILTGTLKDNERAKTIGVKTYGKGVIQTVIPLLDGSGMKITTAEYYTPNGSQINKKGIEPDIEIKLPENIKNIYSVEEKDDTQLKKAIEELSK